MTKKTIDFTPIKSALVSTVLMAVLAICTYILSVGNVYKLDWPTLINLGIISFLTGITSLIKNLLTDKDGSFVGILKVK